MGATRKLNSQRFQIHLKIIFLTLSTTLMPPPLWVLLNIKLPKSFILPLTIHISKVKFPIIKAKIYNLKNLTKLERKTTVQLRKRLVILKRTKILQNINNPDE